MGVFVRQLDGSPHAGDNCGPASLASALRWSTAHSTAPSPSLVRERMGDTEGGTHPRDLANAWESFRDGAKRRGYNLAPIRYRERVDFAKLPELLWRGDAAVIAVDYNNVPRALRGDPFFNGLHAVFVAAITTKAGVVRVKVYDPLCDGRRTGIPGPGPVWWTLSILREAVQGYAGPGKATYNAMARSERIASPEPDGCDEIAAELERTATELGEAQEVLGSLQGALRTILAESETISATTRDALRSIETVLPASDPDARAGSGIVEG